MKDYRLFRTRPRRAVMMVALALSFPRGPRPRPPGRIVDIGGGQSIHLNCTGRAERGSPTVLLESGTGDLSVIWALVQPSVSRQTRVCSYDRGGYGWSDPGALPRSFAQLALELHTALTVARVGPPYVLVGQSYGGLVIRGFAERYRADVVGIVFVDAVHEDQRVVYGGEPHRIRDDARGRAVPEPRIALDSIGARLTRDRVRPATTEALDPPLDRLPSWAQAAWRWAIAQPGLERAREAELDWSPEELGRMHRERDGNRATLADLPIAVLARAKGDYADGMSISADSLERERRALQADLARLSLRGRLIYADRAGHNIHLEDPELVIRWIGRVVTAGRDPRSWEN